MNNEKCSHPQCGFFRDAAGTGCRAMLDNACAREAGNPASVSAPTASDAGTIGPVAITDERGLNGIKWYGAPPAEMRNGVNLYTEADIAKLRSKAPQEPSAGVGEAVKALPTVVWWNDADKHPVFNSANGDDLILRKDVLRILAATAPVSGAQGNLHELAAAIVDHEWTEDGWNCTFCGCRGPEHSGGLLSGHAPGAVPHAADCIVLKAKAIIAAPSAGAPAAETPRVGRLTTLLEAAGARRLVRCHDGSGEPFDAYDKGIADGVVARLQAEMHAMEAAADQFCNANCTWLDHAPGCVRAAVAPVSAAPTAGDGMGALALQYIQNVSDTLSGTYGFTREQCADVVAVMTDTRATLPPSAGAPVSEAAEEPTMTISAAIAHGMALSKSTPVSEAGQAEGVIHQWRCKVGHSGWFDAPKEDAYSRVDEYYEARTLFTQPAAMDEAAETLRFMLAYENDDPAAIKEIQDAFEQQEAINDAQEFARCYCARKMRAALAAPAAPTRDAGQAQAAGLKREHIEAIESLGRNDPAVHAFLSMKRRDGLAWPDVLAQMVIHLARDKAGATARLVSAAAIAPQAEELPALPTNEELEALYEDHVGHPADFGADVLERWGGWQPGLLGQGGALERALRQPQGEAARIAVLEEVAALVTNYMGVPRDLMGTPTAAMKQRAAQGERLAEKIRALPATLARKEGE